MLAHTCLDAFMLKFITGHDFLHIVHLQRSAAETVSACTCTCNWMSVSQPSAIIVTLADVRFSNFIAQL